MGIITKLGIMKDYLFWEPRALELIQGYSVERDNDTRKRHNLRVKKWKNMIHEKDEKRRKKFDKLIKQGKHGQAVKYM